MEIYTLLPAKSYSSMKTEKILNTSSSSPASNRTPNVAQSSIPSLNSAMETSSEETATKIERYIPLNLNSTIEDAPGWKYNDSNNAKENDNDKESSKCLSNKETIDNSKTSNAVGPICWKCRGLGYNQVRNKKNNKKKQKLNASIISVTSDENNENKQRTQNTSICPVCQGNGHIQCKEKELKHQNRAGVITKTRSCSIGWKSKKPLPYVIQTHFSSKITGKETRNDEGKNKSYFHLSRCIEQIYRGLSQDVSVKSFFLHNFHILEQEEQIKKQQSNPLPLWLPREGEQLCNLVGSWRILQRVGSHRWTTDDLVTAHVASSQFVSHFSLDDIRKSPIRYLDLGCGNGSVLQMVLWKLLSHFQHRNEYCDIDNPTDCQEEKSEKKETIKFYVRGIEARSEAVELAKRSLSFNIGYQESKTKNDYNKNKNDFVIDKDEKYKTIRQSINIGVIHNDFRTLIEQGTSIFNDQSHVKNANHAGNGNDTELKFDLVTGTPPYFQVDFQTTTVTNESTSKIKKNSSNMDESKLTKAIINQGGMPTCMQSAPARCEFRGGIEAYCQAASKVLKPTTGIFVVCENYLNHNRVLAAADEYGLVMNCMYFVKGRVGKRVPLFVVYMMMKGAEIKTTTETLSNEDCNSVEKHTVSIELSVRDENGQWTDTYKDFLEDMSIPAY